MAPAPARAGSSRRGAAPLLWGLAGALLALPACEQPVPPEPEPREVRGANSATKPAEKPAPQGASGTRPVAKVPVSPDDPLQGKFTLEDALEGLPGEGKLVALIKTSLGSLSCELYEDKAPITVANFVGLARGKRPWKSESGWITRRFYDNTVIHRVVSGFVIQGGRPFDTVDGGPGYVIPDENWSGAKHDEAGLLCMANEGPNTGGSQFFIMAARSAPQLDGSYTIFGSCFQTDVVDAISRVKAFGERPAEDVILKQVVIKRAPRW